MKSGFKDTLSVVGLPNPTIISPWLMMGRKCSSFVLIEDCSLVYLLYNGTRMQPPGETNASNALLLNSQKHLGILCRDPACLKESRRLSLLFLSNEN